MTFGVKPQGHILDVNHVKSDKNYDVGTMVFTLDDLERLKVKVTTGPYKLLGERSGVSRKSVSRADVGENNGAGAETVEIV